MDDNQVLLNASAYAERIRAEIAAGGGSLDPAFKAAVHIAAAYSKEHGNLQDVLPATDELGQGFLSGKIPSGQAIVRAYMSALAADLCDPRSDLHKRIKRTTDLGATTLIGWLLMVLGLNAPAAILLAPIAGAVLALGLPAYCTAAKGAQ